MNSAEEEGFEQYDLQIIHMERELVTLPHNKVQAANELVAHRIRNTTNCIFTNIGLLPYPPALELPFNEKTVLRELQDDRCRVSSEPMQSLEEHFYDRRFEYRCVYNKLQTKVDFKGEMASIYRNLDYHLDYAPENYRTFMDRDTPVANDLEFSSNFQSGNLLLAYWCPISESYYLLLHHDINSHGYSQWFYFRVRNKDKCRVRFKICNLIKPSKHFLKGMKISIYSLQQKRLCNRNWFKGGQCLQYYRNNLMRRCRDRSHYTLEFAYTFQYANDNVYFAMNIPYTYTQLLKHLTFLQLQDRPEGIVIKHKSLTYTVSNNDIQLVEIYKEQKLPKKAVVVLARQHPCETVASFVVEGMMGFMGKGEQIASQLLDQYRFFFIPMVNPDGVVHGNSRVNLLGVDINRQWQDINKNLSIQVFTIYNWICKLSTEYKIEYVIDLHGHSKKLNTFGYFSDNRLQTKAFANCLSQLTPNFSYQHCTFGISEDKQKTFRSLVYSLGIPNSITIQNSYFGRSLFNNLVHCFTTQDLYDIGYAILKSIHKFTTEKGTQQKIQSYFKAERERTKSKELEGIYKEKEKENSDSDPEGDYLNQTEREEILVVKNDKEVVAEKDISPGKESRRQVSSSQGNRSSSLRRSEINQTVVIIRNDKSRQSKTKVTSRKSNENTRYSSLRHRTQPDQQLSPQPTDPLVRDIYIRPHTTQKFLRKPNSSLNNTSFPFRTLRPHSELIQKKYSSSKVTQYPTSIHPYFSHFVNSVTKLEERNSSRGDSKKVSSSPSKYVKEAEGMMPFSAFVRNPNRLVSSKLQKNDEKRKNIAKRGPNAYALLKQIINISSYRNL